MRSKRTASGPPVREPRAVCPPRAWRSRIESLLVRSRKPQRGRHATASPAGRAGPGTHQRAECACAQQENQGTANCPKKSPPLTANRPAAMAAFISSAADGSTLGRWATASRIARGDAAVSPTGRRQSRATCETLSARALAMASRRWANSSGSSIVSRVSVRPSAVYYP